MVHIGDQTVNDTRFSPMGGTGTSANRGRFGSQAILEECMQQQWISTRPEPATYHF
jgi:hypothetical protein